MKLGSNRTAKIAPPADIGRSDVTSLVNATIAENVRARATDIHFEPVDEGLQVRARIDGMLVNRASIPAPLADNVVARLKVLASLLTYRMDVPQEGGFRFNLDDGGNPQAAVDLRVATFPTIRGERAVVRIFRDATALTGLEDLGLGPDQCSLVRNIVDRPAGFVTVAGPAGSGKTTTLYAILRELRARHPSRSIITLEDPVEQRIDGVTQIQVNPHGELNYKRCMRSLLRQDPQVLLVGEVRDHETAELAFEAALTGHLILTTVHSGDVAETVIRFLDMGIHAYQVVSSLSLVCAQRLLRLRCPERCRPGDTCPRCLGTGYAGRTAVAVTAAMSEPLRNLILTHAPASALNEALSDQGPDLRERAARLVEAGKTDHTEVARVLGNDPNGRPS